MNNFLVQIAKPGIYHRWVSINADDEASARATAAEQFPGFTIVQIIAKGAV